MDYSNIIANINTYISLYKTDDDINTSTTEILQKMKIVFYNFLCKLFIGIYDKINYLEQYINYNGLEKKFQIQFINEMKQVKSKIDINEKIPIDELSDFLQKILQYINCDLILNFNKQDPTELYKILEDIKEYIDNYNYNDINKFFEQTFRQLYLINYKRLLFIRNYFNFAFDQDIILQINKNFDQVLNVYSQDKLNSIQDINKLKNKIDKIKYSFFKNQLYYLDILNINSLIKNYETIIFNDNFLNNIDTCKNYKFVYIQNFTLNIFIYTVNSLLNDFDKKIITNNLLNNEIKNINKKIYEYCLLYNNFYDEYIIKIDNPLTKNMLKIENL